MKMSLPPAVFLSIALFVFGCSVTASAQAQIFVKHNATGANTGASWADAYTNLKTALSAATVGDEIWVATGTYKPDTLTGNAISTFSISKNLRLLGGFAGTETSADERDPVANKTILSGDLNGNDVEDDFSFSYRFDNVLHVVTIPSFITGDAVIDGFQIQGGQADGATSFNGGGIHCLGAPFLRNCIFTQNFAQGNGAGLYVSGAGAQGLRVEHCRFEKNRAARSDGSANGGGMYVTNVKGNGFEVTGTAFISNEADWMGGLSVQNSNGTVDGSTFTNNNTKRHGGGMRVFYQSGNNNLHFQVQNCNFENNKASFGGGLYFLLASQNCNIDIVHCNFLGNAVDSMLTGWGRSFGGLGFYLANTAENCLLSVDSCLFEGNSSSNVHSAFGLESEGQNTSLNLRNTTFKGNVNTGSWATVGIWPFSSADITVDNCLFENNTSLYSAGMDIGPYYGGPSHYAVRNCRFLNNHATAYGGALTIWGDVGTSTNFSIEDCRMEGNTADEGAGAILILTGSNDLHATLNRCEIRNNHSPLGSAIGAFQLGLSAYALHNGALVSIENSLIAGNTGGAALALDSFPNLKLLNSTFADNHGGISLSDSSGITLQNTILYNPGYPEYEALTGDVTFASNGGNLIGDGSLNGQLLATDKQNLDPLFMGAGNYRIGAGSPCIDMGVDSGNLPALDLDGNPRVFGTAVDIGSYESLFTPVREVNAGAVAVSPNPARDFLNIQLPQTITVPMETQVFDMEGRELLRRTFYGGQRMDVLDLQPGMYILKVVAGERFYIGKFVKQ